VNSHGTDQLFRRIENRRSFNLEDKVEIMEHLQGINPSLEDSIFESPYSGLFPDRIDEAPGVGRPTQFQRARGQIELGYALRL